MIFLLGAKSEENFPNNRRGEWRGGLPGPGQSLSFVSFLGPPARSWLAGRFKGEGFLVIGNLDPGHFVGLWLAQNGTDAKERRKH